MNLEFGMVPKITLGDLTFTAFRGLSLNTHTHSHTCTHTHTHTLKHMHTRTHTLKHTGMCMPSHGTHTHVHTCSCTQRRGRVWYRIGIPVCLHQLGRSRANCVFKLVKKSGYIIQCASLVNALICTDIHVHTFL